MSYPKKTITELKDLYRFSLDDHDYFLIHLIEVDGGYSVLIEKEDELDEYRAVWVKTQRGETKVYRTFEAAKKDLKAIFPLFERLAISLTVKGENQ